MSQASRQVADSHTSSISTGDLLTLGSAIVLFIAFWLLPWFSATGASMTGASLMSGQYVSSPVANPAGLLLVPLGAVVGIIAGLLGLLRTDARPVTRYMGLIAGLVVLLYYVSDFLAIQTAPDIGGTVGFGFWLALVAAVVLIAQTFLPRLGLPALSSTDKIRTFQMLLVVAGLVVTGYMSYNKLAGLPLQCSETGLINCSVVENSAWARVAGIPTAILGFIAHVMLGVVLLLETRVGFFRQYGALMLFGIALFGVMYHAYLTYVSLTILKAVCPYCLTAATVMLIQLGACSVRLKGFLATM
jgi:uncharacterized membrane protein